jgi:alkylation response protein AidB-like acyl-CoA dehydrogenase
MGDILTRAKEIAEDVLFPAALGVDASGVIPPSHFDLLAREGFYGLAGKREHGGAEVDLPSLIRIIEALAGACLATTFTWMQHHGLVRSLTTTPNSELRERYLSAAIRGELRAGVTYAGAIPNPPLLWAAATRGGWLVSGQAPLVTGWGMVDVLQVWARKVAPADVGKSPGVLIGGLAAAEAGAGIAVEELRMLAIQGSNTVRLRFRDYYLPAEKVLAEISHLDFLGNQPPTLRLNGCLAMGVAARCIQLITEAGRPRLARALRAEQATIRDRLDGGLTDPDRLPAARAAAAELAFRAAGALLTTVGSRGLLAGQHAHRLIREAAFTLVAASRPNIKANLLELLGRCYG